MLHVLQNESIRVEVSAHGAELQSIFHKGHQLEYLWNGDPAVWARKAPVLFPIVGKLKDNQFTYQGKSYTLPQHGFARDRFFQVIHSSDHEITFRLHEDEETLKQYPFAFILDIQYSIKGNTVQIMYDVCNSSQTKDMFFSIGAHPGFRCPLVDTEAFEEYYLEFEQEEAFDRVLLDGGLRGTENESVALDGNKLPLSADLFKVKDAIVLHNMKSERISLRSTQHTKGIHFNFSNYPWFGIWSKPGPFICLEPWMGVADSINSNQQ
ncbi:MAG: aldose 1-epimerase family protein, partial [Cytophagales bacterium]|nr:aldose 1-epimerase family protein [Cytophaga sp.]